MLSSSACAACRIRRWECEEGCEFKAYFPAEKPERFKAVMRLYGLRKMVAILKKVPKHSRDHAMRSIILESETRDRFKVHGSLGLLNTLKAHLRHKARHLHALHAHIRRRHQLLPPHHTFNQESRLFEDADFGFFF